MGAVGSEHEELAVNAVARRIAAPGPKRILALDGGGVKGLLSAAALVALEHRLAQRSPDPANFRLSDYFDLIGGTSTGAIIATWLALGKSAEEIVAAYKKLCPEVFRPRFSGGGLLRSKIDTKAFARVFDTELGDVTLADAPWRTGWAVMAKRADTGSVWALSNSTYARYWTSQVEGEHANADYRLAAVVRASASAPLFFSPTRIAIAPGDEGVFFDGAVSPHNNPALQLFLMARLASYGFNWPGGRRGLFLLSLGTGWARPQVKPRAILNKPPAFQAVNALKGLIHDAGDWGMQVLQALSEPQTPWVLNSEIGTLAGERIVEEEALAYERLDARLEPAWLADTLGVRVSAREAAGLQNIINKKPKNLAKLEEIGRALGAKAPDTLFPPAFDPSGFRAASHLG